MYRWMLQGGGIFADPLLLGRYPVVRARLEDDDVFLTEKDMKLLIARVAKAEVAIVNLGFDVSHVGGAVGSAQRFVLSTRRWVRLAQSVCPHQQLRTTPS